MNIIKGNIGSGVLSLPYAFSMAGWLAGSVVFVVVAFIAIDCMYLLLAAKRHLSNKYGVSHLSYGDVVSCCCSST